MCVWDLQVPAIQISPLWKSGSTEISHPDQANDYNAVLYVKWNSLVYSEAWIMMAAILQMTFSN